MKLVFWKAKPFEAQSESSDQAGNSRSYTIDKVPPGDGSIANPDEVESLPAGLLDEALGELLRQADAACQGTDPSAVAQGTDPSAVLLSPDSNPVPPPPQPAGKISNAGHRDRSLYHELLAGLYDAVLIVDPRGTVIGSNPRTGKLFGYGEDDLWDAKCEKLIPVMRPTVLAKIRSHVESGRFTIVNASCVRLDGTSFPAEIAINRINLFNVGDLIFSVRSIERRVRAHDRHSLDSTVMDCAAAGIVVCSTDGLVEFANPAFLQIVGLAGEHDVQRRFIGEFCTSNESGMQLLLKIPAGSVRWVGRCRLLNQRGHAVETMATSARTTPKKGDAEQIVLTFSPIPRMATVAAPAPVVQAG